MLKKLLILLAPVFVFFSLTTPVFAQAANRLRVNTDCLYSGDVVTINCIPILFANLIFWLIMLSGTVALFFIIFGGIKLLTSGGDPKNIEGARKIIVWAVIGLVVVLLSFGIVSFIAETTGVRCITNFGFANCGRSIPSGGGSCSASNPSAPCSDGKRCVRVGGPDDFECRHLCGSGRPNGWCKSGLKCKGVTSGGIVIGYACQTDNCASRGTSCGGSVICCDPLSCKNVGGSGIPRYECSP